MRSRGKLPKSINVYLIQNHRLKTSEVSRKKHLFLSKTGLLGYIDLRGILIFRPKRFPKVFKKLNQVKRYITFEVDAFYHLYNRGVNRGLIFLEDENYRFFIRNLERYLSPVLDIHAYCLMPTHYHLVVCVKDNENDDYSGDHADWARQTHLSIIKAIQRFSISYTKAINKRYERVGALFQGSYQAKLIQGMSHSMRIIPYIHENPVQAGLVNIASDWEFSSARIYERIKEPGFIKPFL